jgi:hypothetical protein
VNFQPNPQKNLKLMHWKILRGQTCLQITNNYKKQKIKVNDTENKKRKLNAEYGRTIQQWQRVCMFSNYMTASEKRTNLFPVAI